MNLPRLFDDKGALIDVDASAMDAPTFARYRTICAAYQANKDAESKLADAFAEVNSALEGVKNTQQYFDAHWPRQTQHDLWLENFGPQTRADFGGSNAR